MIGWIKKLYELVETVDSGGARYYVNDAAGIELNGTLTYGGDGSNDIPIEGYVGLVDDNDGGMIAYGELKIMEDLADRLNVLHVVEEMMHS